MRKSICYRITLPNNLHDQIKKLIKFKLNQGFAKNGKLFTKENGAGVNETFICYFLKKVREQYIASQELNSDIEEINRFTQTGLSKYGIINLIKATVNPTIICDLTDVESDILNDCQDYALNDCQNYVLIENYNISRYTDSLIRSISTFDDL